MADDIKQVISKVVSEDAEKKKKTVSTVQLLVFTLDKEEYAVYITDTREIISIPDITPIPNSPKFIKGIINLRGKIIVVVDLEKRFGLVRENKIKSKHIIISEVAENNYGIVVDMVKEVLTVPKTSIQATPELVSAKIKADYLDGVIVIDNKSEEKKEEDKDKEKKKKVEEKQSSRLIILLNLQKLLQEKELLEIGKTINQAKVESKE
jgi:purine-binding chemotaxis protein CheW